MIQVRLTGTRKELEGVVKAFNLNTRLYKNRGESNQYRIYFEANQKQLIEVLNVNSQSKKESPKSWENIFCGG